MRSNAILICKRFKGSIKLIKNSFKGRQKLVQKSIFRSLFGLVMLGFLATGFAQEKETVEPGWFTNMDKAMESAGKDGKLVLAYFSGSDWCKPCIMLKKKILTSDTFKKYASEKLVIVQLDFPAKKKNQLPEDEKKHNEAMAERYNAGGAFPLVALIDKDGEKIGELSGYDRQTPDEYVNQLKEITKNAGKTDN